MAMRGRAKAVRDADIEAAYRRSDEQLAAEPLAAGVRYDGVGDTVTVEMNNGAALVIPRRLMQGLQEATTEQLKRGLVAGQGTALAWPELDADFTVASLLHGIYGGKRWMSELARRAGATRSKAKAAAARANGAKGGRPRNDAPKKHTRATKPPSGRRR